MYCKNCGFSMDDNATICDICGNPIETSQASNNVASSTPNSNATYSTPQREADYASNYVIVGNERPLLGIIGALVGAAIGGASIVLLSRLGFVASISGLILAFCTVKGYNLLGKRITNKGAIICIILILITPYLANRLDWALSIKEVYAEYHLTLMESFSLVSDFIAEGVIDKSTYISGLIMVYLFAAFGAYSFLKSIFT